MTDYGIRGMHLAYDLAEGWDATILVDATQRGGEPGTVYVIEPERRPPTDGAGRRRPDREHAVRRRTGCSPTWCSACPGCSAREAGRVLVVGCEPASVAEGIGLSEPVAAAVDEAVRVVMDLVRDGERAGPARPGGKPASSGGFATKE